MATRRSSAPATLQRFAQRVVNGAPKVMQASRRRVFADVKGATEVDSGHMRDNLEQDGDELSWRVFWRRERFVGQRNAKGVVIREFYPVVRVFGGLGQAGRDPMTPATESERPRVAHGLADLVKRSARGR